MSDLKSLKYYTVELRFAPGILTVPLTLLITALCCYHPSTHIFEAKKRTFDDTALKADADPITSDNASPPPRRQQSLR